MNSMGSAGSGPGLNLVSNALAIARQIRLQDMDQGLPEQEIHTIIGQFSVNWYGIDPVRQFEILRDTWRRLWRHLIIAEFDLARNSSRDPVFFSKVLDIKIEDPCLDNPNLDSLVCFPWNLAYVCADYATKTIYVPISARTANPGSHQNPYRNHKTDRIAS